MTSIDDAGDNLITFLSNISFHDYPIDIYKDKLRKGWSDVVVACCCGDKSVVHSNEVALSQQQPPMKHRSSLDDTTTSSSYLPSTSVNVITRFNSQAWRDCLRRIQWMKLCDDHNNNVIRRCSEPYTAMKTNGCTTMIDESPLTITLDCLNDIRICPTICKIGIFDILWEVLLSLEPCKNTSPSTNSPMHNRNNNNINRFSHSLLSSFLTDNIMRNHPSFQSVPFLNHHLDMMSSVERSAAARSRSFTDRHNVHTATTSRAAYHIIQKWFIEFPERRTVWLTKILELIVTIDRHEDSIVHDLNQQQQTRRPCHNTNIHNITYLDGSADGGTSHLQQQHRHRRVSGGGTPCSLQYLHGELSEDQESALFSRVLRHRSTQRVWMPDNDDYQNIEIQQFQQTMVELWKVKAKCITLFLQFCRKTVLSWMGQKPIPRCRDDSTETILDVYLNVLRLCGRKPSSITSSLRLCGLFLAEVGCDYSTTAISRTPRSGNNRRETLYQPLLDRCWSMAADSSAYCSERDHCTFLRLYCEIITECSYFDDSSRLYTAISPLLCQVMSMDKHLVADTDRNGAVHQPLVDDATTASTQLETRSRHYLQSLAYLLSRRGRMIVNLMHRRAKAEEVDSVLHNKSSLFAHLALKNYRLCEWINPRLPIMEYQRQLKALQLVGIVGTVTSDAPRRLQHRVTDGSSETAETLAMILPFPLRETTTSLETLMERLLPWLCSPFDEENFTRSIFSPYSPTNSIPPTSTSLLLLNEPKSPTVLPDGWNDDLVLNIMLFLNYKRLVRMRTVCSAWKKLADSDIVWRSLYDARFMRCRSLACSKQSPDDLDNIGPARIETWKQLFTSRWHAEREIRFRVCSVDPTWKVRLCGHLGCLSVLSTPTVAKRHEAKHHQQEHNHASLKTAKRRVADSIKRAKCSTMLRGGQTKKHKGA